MAMPHMFCVPCANAYNGGAKTHCVFAGVLSQLHMSGSKAAVECLRYCIYCGTFFSLLHASQAVPLRVWIQVQLPCNALVSIVAVLN